MIISKETELVELAKYMGAGATEADARVFLHGLLKAGYEGEDSVEIPNRAWERVMSEVLPVWLP
jgi:hypothetical protein